MIEVPPHPRETFGWLGESAETAFADALARGRPHHAWLLCGPEGIGKATFAYRAARRLLGAAAAPAFGRLGAAPDDPVSCQVRARAHPDLLVLQLESDDGKPRRSIPAEEARGLGEFFAKSPAAAPWRVAIVDAADDLAETAANAVLKTLEEPPERGILLLVAHAPGRLLPTIRSRCRRLAFPVPAAETALGWLGERGIGADAAAALLAIGGGAPGAAWRLAAGAGLELDAAADDLIARLPQADEAALGALASRFRGAEGVPIFRLLFNRLVAKVQARARELAPADLGAAERWAEASRMLAALAERTLEVNLDRADGLQVAANRLRAVALAC